MSKKNEELTQENIETWREQIKELRHKLFADLKFDKHGRIVRDRLL